MRLGLFGGTFDPVHYAHLLLAERCREQCRLDRVVFVPSAVPPHKRGQELTPGPARIEMLQLAIAGHEQFQISGFEVDRGGVNYTVDTLRHFRGQDPNAELFFLLGADMLHDLPNWREAGTVCGLATITAVRRDGVAEPDFACLAALVPQERIDVFRRHQVEMPAVGLSGTDIRRRVRAGLSIRYMTPRAAEKYIEAHGLYRGDASQVKR
jgi:nicotinate-nucleotide adenylyltransferase